MFYLEEEEVEEITDLDEEAEWITVRKVFNVARHGNSCLYIHRKFTVTDKSPIKGCNEGEIVAVVYKKSDEYRTLFFKFYDCRKFRNPPAAYAVDSSWYYERCDQCMTVDKSKQLIKWIGSAVFNGASLIGRRIQKQFTFTTGRVKTYPWMSGTITAYDNKSKLYDVRFSDGEILKLSEKDVQINLKT